MTVQIPLHGARGVIHGYALVEDEDAERIAQFRWFRLKSPSGKFYAYRSDRRDGKRCAMLMHREVLGMGSDDPMQVDHKNLNGLDNQKSNLRQVTHAQNHQNRPSARGAFSKYRGVYFVKKTGRWRARVALNGKKHEAGSFGLEIEAAVAAAEMRKRLMTHSIETLVA